MPNQSRKPTPPPGCPTVDIDGTQYAVIFHDLFRPHTPEERASLKRSVRARKGCISPVVTYTSSQFGECLIDGFNRVEVCEELGLPLSHQHLGRLPDDEARAMAEELNLARRHLTPAEQQEARKKRVGRVARAKAKGDSIRTIAGREKIAVGQVLRDLAKAGVRVPRSAPPGAPAQPPPATVEVSEPPPVVSTPKIPRTHPHADLVVRLDGLATAIAVAAAGDAKLAAAIAAAGLNPSHALSRVRTAVLSAA